MMTWPEFLDGLQAGIDEANRALDEGRMIDSGLLQPWSPPEDLEPLSIEYLERAQLVNGQLNELERRALRDQESIRTELTRVNGMKNKLTSAGRSQYAESVVPQYVDRSV